MATEAEHSAVLAQYNYMMDGVAQGSVKRVHDELDAQIKMVTRWRSLVHPCRETLRAINTCPISHGRHVKLEKATINVLYDLSDLIRHAAELRSVFAETRDLDWSHFDAPDIDPKAAELLKRTVRGRGLNVNSKRVPSLTASEAAAAAAIGTTPSPSAGAGRKAKRTKFVHTEVRDNGTNRFVRSHPERLPRAAAKIPYRKSGHKSPIPVASPSVARVHTATVVESKSAARATDGITIHESVNKRATATIADAGNESDDSFEQEVRQRLAAAQQWRSTVTDEELYGSVYRGEKRKRTSDIERAVETVTHAVLDLAVAKDGQPAVKDSVSAAKQSGRSLKRTRVTKSAAVQDSTSDPQSKNRNPSSRDEVGTPEVQNQTSSKQPAVTTETASSSTHEPLAGDEPTASQTKPRSVLEKATGLWKMIGLSSGSSRDSERHNKQTGDDANDDIPNADSTDTIPAGGLSSTAIANGQIGDGDGNANGKRPARRSRDSDTRSSTNGTAPPGIARGEVYAQEGRSLSNGRRKARRVGPS